MDYDYLAQSLAALSGVPVRIYRDGKFAGLRHHTKFKPDFAITEEANIFRSPGNVRYYMDENFLCYGLFRAAKDGVSFVMGPVSQVPVDRKLAVKILRTMGESVNRAGEIVDYFSAIPAYPLRNFLQILCTVNFFLNDEKLDVSRLLLEEKGLSAPLPPPAPRGDDSITVHNTDEIEEIMLACVEYGRTDEIEALFRRPIEGRAGTMAADALRQEKNLLICTATLVTRAAIRGGLDRAAAFSLSDSYIQKAELMGDYTGLLRLSAQMVEDFTRRVADVRCGVGTSQLIRDARAYILTHLDRPVTTGELAHATGMNRTYLCKRFQEEAGMTVNRYVTAVKMDEAKRLLKVTKKTPAEIAEVLGYSSQSYFQSVFKKSVGKTPGAYRAEAKGSSSGFPPHQKSTDPEETKRPAPASG